MDTIPIDQIVIGDRQRKDLRDIDSLAESIERYGLIQPIVLDDENRLIAGGRRTEAHKKLGRTEIPFVRLSSLSEVQRQELELEENVRRADLTWQERVLAIDRIHDMRKGNAALAGEKWGYRETGELLDTTHASVWYAVTVAALIKRGDKEVIAQLSLKDAVRLLLRRKEQEAAAELAKRVRIVTPEEQLPEVPVPEQPHDVVPPTPRVPADILVIAGDGIDWLNSQPEESIDHIYTDPPYAIDMDNLDQANVGMNNIERVVAEHQVEANMDLLQRFVNAAERVLRPNGFCVVWYDLDMHQFLKDVADKAGLLVQRWPLVWAKTHACMNNAAAYNFTKSVEFAMVMRKPGAVLAVKQPYCCWFGQTDKREYGVTHPFWKPVTLHKWILGSIALQGSRIVDPFAGAGSIPRACLEAGYKCTAIELLDTHRAEMERVLTQPIKEIAPT